MFYTRSAQILSLVLLVCFSNISLAQTVRSIPTLPCDYYGSEEQVSSLIVGSTVTAYDLDGVQLGSFTVTTDGEFGFLSAAGDDLATVADEGAVDGDIITFYINGVKQQSQAIWKSGNIAQVSIGTPVDAQGFYNLHLDQMPAYTSFNDDFNFSGAAVVDMILDFLDPVNIDDQSALMTYGDINSDGYVSASELMRMLNNKAPTVYNFSSSTTLNQYSNSGLIGSFDATNQDDVMTQLVHWIAYQVPNTEEGKEYVPVAAAVSADPSIYADSDYQHWVSVVGVKTNQDPYPSLNKNHTYSEYYDVPDTLELYGVYLNDPQLNGLGFHSYMTANVWNNQYFRPIAVGLEGAGSYMAVFEPPDKQSVPVHARASLYNNNLKLSLGSPEKAISFYIPGWNNQRTNKYLKNIQQMLNQSQDFQVIQDDNFFASSFKQAGVERAYKVDGNKNDDYTIIPFEQGKRRNKKTTAAVMMNNKTGQFMTAFADPNADALYQPMSWYEAYRALRSHIGWNKGETVINYWMSHKSGSPLYPGWSAVTMTNDLSLDKSYINMRTKKYSVTPTLDVMDEGISPDVNVLYHRTYKARGRHIKIAIIDVADGITLKVMNKNKYQHVDVSRYQERWLVTITDRKRIIANIQVKNADVQGNIKEGGVSYLYLR